MSLCYIIYVATWIQNKRKLLGLSQSLMAQSLSISRPTYIKIEKGERLNNRCFKSFSIDKGTKIQEFKVKDHRGNWRAISTITQGKYLVFVYAFHKKSEALQEKDKDVVRARIRRISP